MTDEIEGFEVLEGEMIAPGIEGYDGHDRKQVDKVFRAMKLAKQLRVAARDLRRVAEWMDWDARRDFEAALKYIREAEQRVEQRVEPAEGQ